MEKIKEFIKNIPNWLKVIAMAFLSFLILINIDKLVAYIDPENKYDLLKLNGFWTLITLILSAPVAFIIWHFRDQNISQQIENSRKDTNLKEFQKLAEWVSGVHLIEDKVTVKTKWEKADNGENKEVIEETREYTQPSENNSISTYSKKNGAVGLQIAAIYNLLPFYRGDHGESFRRPALNLLLSAWKSMQEKELNSEILDAKKIRANGESAIGVAITHTLLAEGGDLLMEFFHELPNVCLAGMNFSLTGLDIEKIHIMFSSEERILHLKSIDFRCSNLQYMSFSRSNLDTLDFSESFLHNTSFIKAEINHCIFDKCLSNNINYSRASLHQASFTNARLPNTNLSFAKIDGCKFTNTNLEMSDLSYSIISLLTSFHGTDFDGSDFTSAYMAGTNLVYARYDYSKFHNAVLTNSQINIECEMVQFQGCNLCNIKLITSEFLYKNNNQFLGTFLLDYKKRNSPTNNNKSEEDDIYLINQCGAIIIKTSNKINHTRKLKFINKLDRSIEHIYNHNYIQDYDLDINAIREINSNWEVIPLE